MRGGSPPGMNRRLSRRRDQRASPAVGSSSPKKAGSASRSRSSSSMRLQRADARPAPLRSRRARRAARCARPGASRAASVQRVVAHAEDVDQQPRRGAARRARVSTSRRWQRDQRVAVRDAAGPRRLRARDDGAAQIGGRRPRSPRPRRPAPPAGGAASGDRLPVALGQLAHGELPDDDAHPREPVLARLPPRARPRARGRRAPRAAPPAFRAMRSTGRRERVGELLREPAPLAPAEARLRARSLRNAAAIGVDVAEAVAEQRAPPRPRSARQGSPSSRTCSDRHLFRAGRGAGPAGRFRSSGEVAEVARRRGARARSGARRPTEQRRRPRAARRAPPPRAPSPPDASACPSRGRSPLPGAAASDRRRRRRARRASATKRSKDGFCERARAAPRARRSGATTGFTGVGSSERAGCRAPRAARARSAIAATGSGCGGASHAAAGAAPRLEHAPGSRKPGPDRRSRRPGGGRASPRWPRYDLLVADAEHAREQGLQARQEPASRPTESSSSARSKRWSVHALGHARERAGAGRAAAARAGPAAPREEQRGRPRSERAREAARDLGVTELPLGLLLALFAASPRHQNMK